MNWAPSVSSPFQKSGVQGLSSEQDCGRTEVEACFHSVPFYWTWNNSSLSFSFLSYHLPIFSGLSHRATEWPHTALWIYLTTTIIQRPCCRCPCLQRLVPFGMWHQNSLSRETHLSLSVVIFHMGESCSSSCSSSPGYIWHFFSDLYFLTNA